MTNSPNMDKAIDSVERSYSILKSLNSFDDIEVKPVIDTLMDLKERDNCFVGLYTRGKFGGQTGLVLSG